MGPTTVEPIIKQSSFYLYFHSTVEVVHLTLADSTSYHLVRLVLPRSNHSQINR